MSEAGRIVPPRARTDWSSIFTSTLIPLTIAAGFVWFGLNQDEAGDWARGLLALIPFEYFRAFVLYILSDTYREYRSPMQAVRFFLLSFAILIGIALVTSLYVLKGDWWAWITQPEVYRAIAFALSVIVVDGVIGVYFFRGDPKQLSVRFEAVADDARDWIQLAGIQLPVLIVLLYGFLLLLREAGHMIPWLPTPTSEMMISAGLLYAAFFFFGKAMLIAHASTAEFNATGQRLFGAPAIQWLIWEKNKNAELSAFSERAAAKRRRAVLMGEAEEPT